MSKHLFAFYYAELSLALEKRSDALVVHDSLLVRRLITVLRMKNNDECILFNEQVNARVQLSKSTKKELTFTILTVCQNESIKPAITFLLPVLKKSALEEAVYQLTEVGVNSIQLILTQRSRRSLTQKEYERLAKVVVAASEQSKQFVVPCVGKPVSMVKGIANDHSSLKLCGDIEGDALFAVLKKYATVSAVTITIGPEADFTNEERALLVQAGFTMCSLTPTVLRSVQAASLLGGLCRTYFG